MRGLPIAVKEIEACVLALLQREMPERSAHKKAVPGRDGFFLFLIMHMLEDALRFMFRNVSSCSIG